MSPNITQGGKDYLDRTVQVLTPAFADDPVYTWLLKDFPLSKHPNVLPKLFTAFFTQGTLNGGVFMESADWGCCGLFMPPGRTVENPWTMLSAGLISALWNIGVGGFKRALFDYGGAVEPLMKKALTKAELREHWYVFIMGTAVDSRRRGYAGQLLVHLQDKAREDGCPIWLEATTPESKELYLKHGFSLVGDVSLGKGSVGANGLPKKQGEGITIWSMVWRP